MIKKLARLLLVITLVGGTAGFIAVQADEAPPAGFSRVYVNIQAGGKGNVVSAIAAAGGTVHYEFDAIGAVAATLPDAAIAALGNNPNVSGIEPDPQRFLLAEQVPYGIAAVQAPAAVAAGADGLGVTVGVIDSGVYTGHEDLDAGRLDGYPKVQSVKVSTKGKPVYDTVVLGSDDEAYWGRDYLGHGTHVSGTITAVGGNGKGVVGVSPGNVDIFMVKVFGDAGDWIYSSTLVNAVQQAVSNGATIINMSLGGPVASASEESGMNSFESQGVLLIAAAGNDGNTAFSYPASYNSVVSVGAVDSSNAIASFSQQNNQVELVAPGVGVLSTVPFADTTSVHTAATGTIDANAIEGAALSSGASGALVNGGLAESGDPSWAGKVVLVERGSNSFAAKVSNVEASGGVAAVIYNNVSGNFLGTLGAGNSSSIPAISISQADGQALLAAALNAEATVVNQFEIPASGYEAWNGTSMATPHVSGVAALLKSAFPNASNQDIREAMAASALDLGTTGRDNTFGFGLVQADDALAALPAIIEANAGSGGSGNTGAPVITDVSSSLPTKNGSFSISWTTNEPATSDVYFEGIGLYANSELVTQHKRSFRGTKGVTYIYTVSSTDADGNTTTAGPFTHQN